MLNRLTLISFFSASLAASIVLIIPWPFAVVQAAAVFIFFISQGIILGQFYFPSKQLGFKLILGLITLLTFLILAGSVSFYFFNLSQQAITSITLLVPLLTLLPLRHRSTASIFPVERISLSADFLSSSLILAYIATCALLLWNLWDHSTLEALQSPWLAVPREVFLLYFLATLLLVCIARIAKRFSAALYFVHFLISTGAVLFIYQLGFGFDPFIHQTAEHIIFEAGTLSPKPFYYVGQYALITWLATWLPISIEKLDTWLLPLITSCILPSVIYYAFKYNFKTAAAPLSVTPILFLIFPYPSLIQSTPQGLSFLWTLLIIFLSLFYIQRQGVSLPYIFFLALAAMAIHPLSGIPLLLFVVLLGLYQYLWRTDGAKKVISLTFYWISTIAASVILPLIFVANAYILKKNSITISVGEQQVTFLDPFIPVYHRFIRLEDLLYTYGANTRLLLFVLAATAVGLALYKKRGRFFMHYVVTFGALLVNYILLTALIKFDFLVESERFVFPERILNLGFYFLLPLVFLTLYWYLKELFQKNRVMHVVTLVIIAGLATISWYLSYPRFDYYDQSKGFSTSAYDYQAVTWIEQDAAGEPYVVLANQAVSAAALTTYGFAHYYNDIFYYPIPTGDTLYQSYLDVVQNRKPTTSVIREVYALTETPTIYIVLNNYWFGFEDIIARLAADDAYTQVIGNEKIYIFRYTVDKK